VKLQASTAVSNPSLSELLMSLQGPLTLVVGTENKHTLTAVK